MEEEILQVLRQIEGWLKVISIPKVKELLESTLQTPEERKVYHYSDGRSQNEIANLVKVSQPTVSNYWKKWAKLGIIQQSKSYKGRYEKSFLLEDFNITFDQ